MATPIYNRYSLVQGTASQINTPGFVNAYKLNPDGTPVGGIPDLGTGTTPPNPIASESALDKAQREYFEGLNRTQPDEAAIRENVRKNMQYAIDAIEKRYNVLREEEQLNAQDRLGQTRAINARSGLPGSDFGAANMSGTQAQNDRVRRALEADYSQQIASVFAKIDATARDEIRAKKEEATGNAKAYIDYLAGAQKSARDNVKTLAEGGVPLEQLNTEQYQKLLKASGFDDFTFKAYYNSNKPAGTKTPYKTEIKGGKIIAYGVNSAGQIEMTSKDLPAGVNAADGEYEERFAPDGTLILVPKNFDTSKPLSSQIIQAGNYAKPEKDTSKQGYNDASLKERSEAIAWVRKQPGFTDADIQALKTDNEFFLWALGEAGLAY